MVNPKMVKKARRQSKKAKAEAGAEGGYTLSSGTTISLPASLLSISTRFGASLMINWFTLSVHKSAGFCLPCAFL